MATKVAEAGIVLGLEQLPRGDQKADARLVIPGDAFLELDRDGECMRISGGAARKSDSTAEVIPKVAQPFGAGLVEVGAFLQ
jgi:hypothetical protein